MRINQFYFFTILMGLLISTPILKGQTFENPCGSNKTVDTYMEGMVYDGDNCMTIANTTNMQAAIVEVWVGGGVCNGFPNTIEISAGGVSQTAAIIDVPQAPTGEMEKLYRTSFTGSFDEVCITNLNSCDDAYSMAIYVERDSENSASVTKFFDREFYGPAFNTTDCGSQTLIIGTSEEARDVTITIPVHEKSDDGRELEIRVQARLADGTVVNTETITENSQNAGEDASLYVIDMLNVQADVDRFRIRVCSPENNGDSFGISSVAVSTNGCTPPPPVLAGLGNFTFQDLDDNGMYNPEFETPVVGVEIYLYNATDLTQPIDSTVSDNVGFYQFIDLDPELDYVVQFNNVPGFTRSSPNFPSSEGEEDKNDADFFTGFTDVIDLDPGEFDPTIDAGYTPSRGISGALILQGPAIIASAAAAKPSVGGANINFKSNTDLVWAMSTNLIKDNLIPTTDPYAAMPEFTHVNNSYGTESVAPEMLTYTGDHNNIVDWVFMQLRDPDDPTIVVSTRSVLIQKSGQLIDKDGNTDIQFDVPIGEYYVAVKHRNHLGVMTANPVTIGEGEIPYLDFSNPALETWGENAQAMLDETTRALWAGNANADDKVIFQGTGDDNAKGFFDVLTAEGNEAGNLSFSASGYYNSDTKLSCFTTFQGEGNSNNDRFFSVLTHPKNNQGVLNFIIEEKIPK